MNSEWINHVRPWLVGAWHLVGTLLIAWLFLILLMAASAQSLVVERLGNAGPAAAPGQPASPLAYSSGYAAWQQSRAIESDLARQRLKQALAVQRRDQLRERLDYQQDELLVRVARLQALALRLQDNANCKFRGTRLTASDVGEAISSLKICLAIASETLPTPLQGEIKVTLDDAKSLLAVASSAMRTERRLARTEMLIASRDRSIKGAIAEQESFKAPREAFGELTVLQTYPLLGGTFLISFPPSMIQIFLAFAAGMFGALLITLVLIVYPNNELRFTSSNAGYAARVMLGGLISICVFVVIGGGTAVLGTGSAFTGGDVNYLAFCAIGILAGMFSDRVAHWLSDRAQTLFEDEGDAVTKAVEAANASDVAKHAADVAASANTEAAHAAAARATEALAHKDEP